MLQADRDYFDDFVEGHSYAPFKWRITAEDVAAFDGCLAVGPLRRADGSVVEAAASSGTVLSPFILNTFKAMRAGIRMPDGLLHAKETMMLHAPAQVGDELVAILKIKSKYLKNGRKFVVLEHTITRADDGKPVMTIDRLVVWVN